MLLGVARTKQNFDAPNCPKTIAIVRARQEIVSNECVSRYNCKSDVLVKQILHADPKKIGNDDPPSIFCTK